MSHATLIVFIFSLAAGFAGISLLNELYHRHARNYLRVGVWQLLFFNLVLLVQLLYSYYSLNLAGERGVSIHFVTTYLTVSSLLKLGWVTLLGIMAANLLGIIVPRRVGRSLYGAAIGLLVILIVMAYKTVRKSDPGSLFYLQQITELFVGAATLIIFVFLLTRYRHVSTIDERRLARDFGWTIFAIWLPVFVSIVFGNLFWQNSTEFRLLIHSILLLGYNLAPFLLLRKRLPKLPPFQVGREPDWPALIDRYGITRREREIIELICRGRKNQEIADELFVSLQTVKDHNHRIFRKLGVKTRVQATNLVRGDKCV